MFSVFSFIIGTILGCIIGIAAAFFILFKKE